MTIDNYTNTELLNALITRGILTQSQADAATRKADRALSRQVKAEALNALKVEIVEAITGGTDRVFSVKKTGNSTGVMDLVNAERGQVLKALTALTADGVFRKVGFVGGEEKPLDEVNAFQIRYIFDAAVSTEEPTEEA